MSKRLNLLGQRFGELRVVAPLTRRADGRMVWLCECACGREARVCSKHLKSGTTKSCGCAPKGRTPDRSKAAWYRADPAQYETVDDALSTLESLA